MRIASRGSTASHLKLLAAGQAERLAVAGGRRLRPMRSSSPDGPTNASESLLLYFTSGTTAKPKLVQHTHVSYPVGHLSTMYWLGLRPGDVHLNLSSPGWAKHAWSSFFAPWNAEATIVAMQTARFDAAQLLRELVRCEVTSFCAPPTVWRALIQLPLKDAKVKLRELLSAGEPLNPEVIAQVRDGLGPDDPRRLRPDGDDAAGRQLPGPTGEGRLDGTRGARLPDRAARRRRPRARGGRDLRRARGAIRSP